MMTIRTHAYPLSQALDRMGTLARALDRTFPGDRAAPVWVPALELAERSDAYLIAAELPGVREDQLELAFENNVLTIRGTRTPNFAAAEQGDLRLHLYERQTGAFERAVRLPEFVEADRIEARLVNGVLLVTIPKAAAAQPRKIQVTWSNDASAPEPARLEEAARSDDAA